MLANPRSCGPTVARTEADFTPWSTGPGVSDSTPSYEFVVEGCDGHQFNPSFKAGMPNIQAGAFSEFTLAFGRSDQDQYLSGISTTMPPGLLGSLTGVELCREAQANAGTCGPNSLIGTTEVLTGPGADPFLVTGGKVYLTEGYGGAPFGLSIVVPAVAGPYTLSGLNVSGEPGTAKGRQGEDHDQPLHGRVERRQQQDADDARRHPAANARGERADQPAGIHVQPDELQQDGAHRDTLQRGRDERERVELRSRSRTART